MDNAGNATTLLQAQCSALFGEYLRDCGEAEMQVCYSSVVVTFLSLLIQPKLVHFADENLLMSTVAVIHVLNANTLLAYCSCRSSNY